MESVNAQVAEALLYATSQTDQQKRQDGEKMLENLSKEINFEEVLLSILCDGSIPVEARFIAISTLKMRLRVNLKRGRKDSVPPEIRLQLMRTVLELAQQPLEKIISEQIAQLFAQLVRLDYPRLYPELFSDISKALSRLSRSSDSLAKANFGTVLMHALKAVDNIFIGPAVSATKQAAVELHPEVAEALIENLGKIGESNEMNRFCYSLVKAHGILTRMNDRFHKLHYVDSVTRALNNVIENFVLGKDWPSKTSLQKLLLRVFKLYVQLSSRHSVQLVLVPSFEGTLQILHQMLNTKLGAVDSEDSGPYSQTRCVIHCMNTLRQITPLAMPSMLQSISRNYKIKSIEDEQDILNAAARCKGVAEMFFTPQLLEQIIMNYMVTDDQTKELWRTEPEEIYETEAAANVEVDIMKCTQSLFSKILQTSPTQCQSIVAFVTKVFGDGAENRDGKAIEGALQALRFGSHEFAQDQQLRLALRGPIAQNIIGTNSDDSKILRRRFCELLNEFILAESDMEFSLWSLQFAIENLLAPSPFNDVLVRLSALTLVKHLSEDIDMEQEVLVTCSDVIFAEADKLMQAVESVSAKASVLEAITAYVEQLGPLCSESQRNTVMRTLYSLWESPGEEIIRVYTLQSLTTIIDSWGSVSPEVLEMALSVLNQALHDPQNIDETVLVLWKSVLVNSSHPDPRISRLVPILAQSLSDEDSITLKFDVLESYAKLGPALDIDTATQRSIFQGFTEALRLESPETALLALRCILLFASRQSQWTGALLQSDADLANAISALFGINQTLEIQSMIVEKLLEICAWNVLNGLDCMLLLSKLAPTLPNSLMLWASRISEVNNPQLKRLHIVALALILANIPEATPELAGLLVQVWAYALSELPYSGVLPTKQLESSDLVELTEEQIRDKHFANSNALHRINMQESIIAGVRRLSQLGFDVQPLDHFAA